MTIYIGADHNGFKLKEDIKAFLTKKDYLVKDLGNHKFQKTDDFPDFAKPVAKAVKKDKNSLGIILCGSGQGACITANRFKGIRAGLGWSVAVAKRSRHDDDTNILCLPAWTVSREQALRIVSAWLDTKYSAMTRFKRRLKKIDA